MVKTTFYVFDVPGILFIFTVYAYLGGPRQTGAQQCRESIRNQAWSITN